MASEPAVGAEFRPPWVGGAQTSVYGSGSGKHNPPRSELEPRLGAASLLSAGKVVLWRLPEMLPVSWQHTCIMFHACSHDWAFPLNKVRLPVGFLWYIFKVKHHLSKFELYFQDNFQQTKWGFAVGQNGKQTTSRLHQSRFYFSINI